MQKYKINVISGKIFSENRDLFSEKTFVWEIQATLEQTIRCDFTVKRIKEADLYDLSEMNRTMNIALTIR